MAKFTQQDAVREILEQLTSEKRKLGFLMGAGTSMAIGIPGIESLTEQVHGKLDATDKKVYDSIKETIAVSPNIEKILDKIRLCRELFEGDKSGEYLGIKGMDAATELDVKICHNIREVIQSDKSLDITPHKKFSQWLKFLHSSRISPVEIFTLNYDLVFEEAMEETGVPFFDGFIGSSHPFFAPESVDVEYGESNNIFYPPTGWTRLWKLHGSINWFSVKRGENSIITRSSYPKEEKGQELMIFPSREKYSQSRKLPFLTFQDRLRKFLAKGETLLVVCGYSFSDQHINEILFQGLRSNPRLTIIAFIYGNPISGSEQRKISDTIIGYGKKYRNITVIGPDQYSIGGIVEKWEQITIKENGDEISKYWDSKNFTLGDFKSFTSFLEFFFSRNSMLQNTEEPSVPVAVAKKES
jgi:hypothetical protein